MHHAKEESPDRVSISSTVATEQVAYWSACRMTITTDCNTEVNSNKGCGTEVRSLDSYGEGLNSVRGGFYAMARSKEYGIKVWFWPREDFLAPFDVRSDEETVNPDLWGEPIAYFPTGGNCEYEEHFDAHRIVFDLTFCVRWFSSPVGLLIEEMCSFVMTSG